MNKLLLLVFTVVCLVFITPKETFASHFSFEDDFNNPATSSTDWVTSGPQLLNGDNSPANWKFENGTATMKIVNKGFQFNELIPTSWDSEIKDYEMEVDVKLINGVDTNLVFRYQDHGNWYGIHGINNENKLILQKAGGSWFTVPPVKAFTFTPNTFYKFKILVKDENIKIYINNNLYWDITDTGTHLTHGAPGLQASTGAINSSEVAFDNFKVTSIDNTLPVPYYSQNDNPWGPQEYDSGISLGMDDPTMNRWGCAVTSAAMILNYHKMNNFGSQFNNQPINPGTLNEWLKANGGYTSHGTIIWGAIGTLSQRLYNIGLASYKLTAQPFADHSLLEEDLIEKEQFGSTIAAPAILKVTKAGLTTSHYVVATGFNDQSITINDPESWKYPDLSHYDNDNFIDLHRYIPSQTDLSQIYLAVNPNTELLITDTQGRKTGRIVEDGEVRVFNEIPNAVYTFEEPISNPNENGELEEFGTGANIFYLPTPDLGNYLIKVSSLSVNTDYKVDVSNFEKDGDFTTSIIGGITGHINPDTFQIQYSQEEESVVEKVVTFDSALADLEELWEAKEITNMGAYKSLDAVLSNAKRFAERNQQKPLDSSLELFEKSIKTHKKFISSQAAEILQYNVDYLQDHY